MPLYYNSILLPRSMQYTALSFYGKVLSSSLIHASCHPRLGDYSRPCWWYAVNDYIAMTHILWGRVCQNQGSKVGTSNYIPQYLWDVITCPCPWYLLLAHKSTYMPHCTILVLGLIEHLAFAWPRPICLNVYPFNKGSSDNLRPDILWIFMLISTILISVVSLVSLWLADTPVPPTGIDSVYNKVKSLHVLYFL